MATTFFCAVLPQFVGLTVTTLSFLESFVEINTLVVLVASSVTVVDTPFVVVGVGSVTVVVGTVEVLESVAVPVKYVRLTYCPGENVKSGGAKSG